MSAGRLIYEGVAEAREQICDYAGHDWMDAGAVETCTSCGAERIFDEPEARAMSNPTETEEQK